MTSDISNAELIIQNNHGIISIEDMRKVIQSMRFSSLQGLKLRSDRQPKKIIIENIQTNPGNWAPIVLAVARPDGAAWIRVTVDGNHWARLAYQFGHELGHVLSNTWGANCLPQTPCQFIEEICVEAFSIRSLYEISKRWEKKSPYPNWKSYAIHFNDYANGALLTYSRLASKVVTNDLTVSDIYKTRLSKLLKLGTAAKALVPSMTKMIIKDKTLIEDFCALNRWPERSSLPIDVYIDNWILSCKSINAPGILPQKIKEVLIRAAWW